MADRIGVINKGELILVEDKAVADAQARQAAADPARCRSRCERIPDALADAAAGAVRRTAATLIYTFDVRRASTPASRALLRQLGGHGIDFKDLQSSESSLEDIFVSLVQGRGA